MVCEDSNWVPGAFEVVPPVPARHDYSEHLLVAKGIISLCRSHAAQPECDRVPVAQGRFPPARGRWLSGLGLVVIRKLQSDACNREPRGVCFKADRFFWAEIDEDRGFSKGLLEVVESVTHLVSVPENRCELAGFAVLEHI